MELPNDIASCHRIIRELVSVIEGFKPQLEGYVQQIEAQSNQIDHLERRVKELEWQLNQNSRNSNFPPSQDKYKPKPAFPRIKGGPIGGKKGHDGGTLKMVSDPDIVKLFISPKLDHPFRSKLDHPEQHVKERVKIGLRFG